MTEFKNGDIVRMTLGEPDKPGYEVRVREVSVSAAYLQQTPGSLRIYQDQGWTVELVSRPAPPMPTKPNALGWATHGGERRLVRLGVNGWWSYSASGFTYSPTEDDLDDFTEAVLIPKILADEITEWAQDSDGVNGDWILRDLADLLKGDSDE